MQVEGPYFSYSESSKIRCVSRSTKIVNPASISRFDVVGVSAERRSNFFFSHRNQRVRGSEDILPEDENDECKLSGLKCLRVLQLPNDLCDKIRSPPILRSVEKCKLLLIRCSRREKCNR